MTTPAVPGITPRAWPPPAYDTPEQQPSPVVSGERVGVDGQSVDFSVPKKDIFFTMDGERYDCKRGIGPATAQKLAVLLRSGGGIGELTAENMDENSVMHAMDSIAALFSVVLKKESAERFVARLQDEDDPLDLQRQVLPAMMWLMEQYGLRPTQPVSESSPGLPTFEIGTSSTGGARHVASTPSS